MDRSDSLLHSCYTLDISCISKHHFRVYAISYEDTHNGDDAPDDDFHAPLIFCEDLESSNGTYINGKLIGRIGKERVGYLLTHGDVIEVRPYWTFLFLQRESGNPLLPLPWQEQTKV